MMLFFRMVTHKAACRTVSRPFEINEDMVQILLMLELLVTQDSKVKDLFCGAPSGSAPSLFFSSYLIRLGFKDRDGIILRGLTSIVSFSLLLT